jgi:hypothetical protein
VKEAIIMSQVTTEKTVQTQVRLPLSLHKQARIRGVLDRMPLHEVIRHAVEAYCAPVWDGVEDKTEAQPLRQPRGQAPRMPKAPKKAPKPAPEVAPDTVRSEAEPKVTEAPVRNVARNPFKAGPDDLG